ncbi:MAG: Transcriptional regulatory protein zraR [Candidatus Rifleibacterium amylolyticum]|nr:MAG: Transcriptional regulatory protein zraR [Candidatus Rifleibacterium amylolyticum]NLF96886.1 sigma-54-dependent Fis family transcriptional regulator [Candidatus Riflebacteria bacterium]
MNKNDQLRGLAGEFLARFSPDMLKQVDYLFEHLKSDTASKLEVNFGLAMPPEMRQRVLYSIGIEDAAAPPVADRYVPYLLILKKLLDQVGDNLQEIRQEEIAGLIWQEGRRMRLFEYEIQQLIDIFPAWLAGISRKYVVEISPASICKVDSGASESDDGSEIAFNGIVGRSETMRSMFACLKKISASNLSILIQGESGTGKELVAHAIHSLSDRSSHSFIPVNCGALPDTIIESELFGYEKGAFTGAESQKKGYFEIADQGTIFLDEITETSLPTQVKLLRVLQEKQFYRVGGTKPVSANCRIIAATNRDILEMAKDGSFRHDLYYRVNEMTIALPPLRERKDDLPLLVKHFLKKFAEQNKCEIPEVAKESWQLIKNYSWPGNIRELENALKRAVVLADAQILPEHFPPVMLDQAGRHTALQAAAGNGTYETLMESAEREILIEQLKKHNNNVSKTADALAISRRTLQRRLKHLGIEKN